MNFLKYVPLIVFVFISAVPLYALPATLSLPPGPRQGVEETTIREAAAQLAASGAESWDLVEAARGMVGERMQYSRRNSFDSPGRAFMRGYGYCMQHAYALQQLLTELGINAKVVQAFQNRFKDGKVTSHAWVSVSLDGEVRHIDPLFFDEQYQQLDFIPLSKITSISPIFKLITFWGGPAVNAHRYYLTGKDL
jgi:transglutaminase-like putative cysteine protease